MSAPIELPDTPDFKLITYMGGGYTHFVFGRTQALFPYGARDYGIHKRGDQFRVHVDDIAADPDLFIVVEAEAQTVDENEDNGESSPPAQPPVSATLEVGDAATATDDEPPATDKESDEPIATTDSELTPAQKRAATIAAKKEAQAAAHA